MDVAQMAQEHFCSVKSSDAVVQPRIMFEIGETLKGSERQGLYKL